MTDHHLRSTPPTPRLRTVTTESTLRGMEDALKTQQIGQAVEHVSEKDIGRLSAEAVLSQYEAAAKAVETMGDEIKNRIGKLEAAMRDADEAMKLVAEAAHSIREKGKLVQVQIEEAAQVSRDIRDTCAEFRRKVGA